MKEINSKLFKIDKVLSQANKLALISIVLSFLSVLFVIIYGYNIYQSSSNNIFVLDNEGDINPAYKTDVKNNLEAETDNHIKMFYNTFFSYDPTNLESNLKKGLELGGKSVKNLWKLYLQKNYYNQVKQNNLIIKSTVDSTVFDYNKKPFLVKVYGKQKIMSGNKIQTRSLNITCNIKKVARVKNKNPHGLLIENLIITENKILDDEKE